MITLDLGCGSHKTPGAVGLDILVDSEADVLGDIHHLPFRSRVFKRAYAKEILEHIHTPLRALEEVVG